MDSKHRHELRESDLVEGLTHFKDVWQRYGNIVLIAVLLVATFFAVSRLIRVTREQAHERRWSDLAGATDPEAFKSIAQASKDDSVKALAYLRGADLLLSKAALPSAPAAVPPADDKQAPAPPPTTPISDQDRQGMVEDAALLYEQVLALKDVHEAYRFNAQLGLAAVAENRKQLDQARELYQKVQSGAAERYPAVAAQASGRLAVLDRLSLPVKFAPKVEPAPAPQPAEQPEATPAPAPAAEAAPEAAPAPQNP